MPHLVLMTCLFQSLSYEQPSGTLIHTSAGTRLLTDSKPESIDTSSNDKDTKIPLYIRHDCINQPLWFSPEKSKFAPLDLILWFGRV